jgi:hypothetical protein
MTMVEVDDGAHAILYSDDADATRAALAKVLRTRSVDAGGGWLIFALPPAEIAVHPAEEGGRAELYLLCDDVAATVAALQGEGIQVARPISDQSWGLLTAITLPGGVELGCQIAGGGSGTSTGVRDLRQSTPRGDFCGSSAGLVRNKLLAVPVRPVSRASGGGHLAPRHADALKSSL